MCAMAPTRTHPHPTSTPPVPTRPSTTTPFPLLLPKTSPPPRSCHKLSSTISSKAPLDQMKKVTRSTGTTGSGTETGVTAMGDAAVVGDDDMDMVEPGEGT